MSFIVARPLHNIMVFFDEPIKYLFLKTNEASLSEKAFSQNKLRHYYDYYFNLH